MSAEEFDNHAVALADSLDDHDLDGRIAAACRGSGNPAGLAWLAEGLRLQPGHRVVDLGSGLGGPAAWLERHYRCRVIGVEPAPGSVEGATNLFGTAVLRSTATATPFHAGTFDAALLLGVLSVVPDLGAALREARRLAAGLGVLEWCSTGDTSLNAGGSRFPSADGLDCAIERSGWSIVQAAPLDLPAPAAWDEAAPDLDDPPDDERQVREVISAGRLRVRLVVAGRGR